MAGKPCAAILTQVNRTALADRVADWWERALALGPLRFRDLEQGLPSDG